VSVFDLAEAILASRPEECADAERIDQALKANLVLRRQAADWARRFLEIERATLDEEIADIARRLRAEMDKNPAGETGCD